VADAVAEGLISRSSAGQSEGAPAAEPMPEWEAEMLGAEAVVEATDPQAAALAAAAEAPVAEAEPAAASEPAVETVPAAAEETAPEAE
jgi:small subunit ribosomal protein S2